MIVNRNYSQYKSLSYYDISVENKFCYKSDILCLYFFYFKICLILSIQNNQVLIFLNTM